MIIGVVGRADHRRKIRRARLYRIVVIKKILNDEVNGLLRWSYLIVLNSN